MLLFFAVAALSDSSLPFLERGCVFPFMRSASGPASLSSCVCMMVARLSPFFFSLGHVREVAFFFLVGAEVVMSL